MPSARIYQFPKAARRRPVSVRRAIRRQTPYRSGGFGLLLFVTLLVTFFYLSGAMNVARHDALYAVLLAAVWCGYFAHQPLLRSRGLGPFLALAGRVVPAGFLACFFGFVYWLVLTHP